jgi:hypothetical protein
LEKQFSKGKKKERERKVANKYMKECSTSLVRKEIQVKTTLGFHLTSVRMAIIKKTNKYWRGCPGGGEESNPYALLEM